LISQFINLVIQIRSDRKAVRTPQTKAAEVWIKFELFALPAKITQKDRGGNPPSVWPNGRPDFCWFCWFGSHFFPSPVSDLLIDGIEDVVIIPGRMPSFRPDLLRDVVAVARYLSVACCLTR